MNEKNQEVFVPGQGQEQPGGSIDSKDPDRTVPSLGLPTATQPPPEPGPEVEERMSIQDDEPVEEQKETLSAETCPQCKRPYAQDGIPEEEIEDEDKKRWLRYILGEERFKKTYTLMGGILLITLRTRTVQETDQVFAQMSIDMGKERISPIPAYANPEYYLRLRRLMLPFTLEKVEVVHEEGKRDTRLFPVVDDETYPPDENQQRKEGEKPDLAVCRACDALTATFKNEGVYTAALGSLEHFESLVGTLTRRSKDENFWKAADGQD